MSPHVRAITTGDASVSVMESSSNCGKLTLKELQQELRRRNAKISGRKQELVER